MINLGEKMIYTIESRFNYNDREVRIIIDNLCNVDYELDIIIYNHLLDHNNNTQYYIITLKA